MPIARESQVEAAMLDRFASIMGHEYRRRIVFLLHMNDHSLAVPEEVLNHEQDRERVMLELHHNHLPMLEDAEFIDWNRRRGLVEQGTRFEQLDPLLEILRNYYEYVVPRSGSSQAV